MQIVYIVNNLPPLCLKVAQLDWEETEVGMERGEDREEKRRNERENRKWRKEGEEREESEEDEEEKSGGQIGEKRKWGRWDGRESWKSVITRSKSM